jgi:hypothetical protein
MMFGLVAGGGISLFGSITVGAFFADASNLYRIPLLIFGAIFLAGVYIGSMFLYFYALKKSK